MTPEEVAQRLMVQAGSKALGRDARREPIESPHKYIRPYWDLAEWAAQSMPSPMLFDWLPAGTERDGVAGNMALRYDQHEPCKLGSIYDVHGWWGGRFEATTVLYMGDPTTAGSTVAKAWEANPAHCMRHLLLPPTEAAMHPKLIVALDRLGAPRVGRDGQWHRPRWDGLALGEIVQVGSEHCWIYEVPICCDEQTYRRRHGFAQYIMVSHRGNESPDAYVRHIAKFLADSPNNNVACNFSELRRDWTDYGTACEKIAAAVNEIKEVSDG